MRKRSNAACWPGSGQEGTVMRECRGDTVGSGAPARQLASISAACTCPHHACQLYAYVAHASCMPTLRMPVVC